MGEIKSEGKKRGGCLTAFLVVYIALMIISVIAGFFSKNSLLMKGAATWAIAASDIFRVVIIIGGIGTLIWRKWGVYLFAAGCTALTVLSIFTESGGLKPINLGASIIGLIVVVGILALLVRPVWKHMK